MSVHIDEIVAIEESLAIIGDVIWGCWHWKDLETRLTTDIKCHHTIWQGYIPYVENLQNWKWRKKATTKALYNLMSANIASKTVVKIGKGKESDSVIF